jgi:DNA-binding transcriptional MerR regulator
MHMSPIAIHKKNIVTSKSSLHQHNSILHCIYKLLRRPLLFVAVFTALLAGFTAAMVDLKEKYAPLRIAAARALLEAEDNQNQTSSFTQLSFVLNNWSGINEESETHAIVDTDLLVAAFKPRGVDVDVIEYIISYEDLGFGLEEINNICDGNSYNEEEHLLLVRVGLPPVGQNTTKKHMHYEVCHLINNDEEQRCMKLRNPTEHEAIHYKDGLGKYDVFVPPPGAHKSKVMKWHPLDPPYTASDKITTKMKEAVQSFLKVVKDDRDEVKKRKANTTTNTNNKKKKKQKRNKGGKFTKAKEGGDSSMEEDDDIDSPQRSPQVSAQFSGPIKTVTDLKKRMVDVSLNDLDEKIAKQRKKVVESAMVLNKLVRQSIQDSTQQPDRFVLDNENEEPRQKLVTPLKFMLPNGRIGEVLTIEEGIIFINELYDSLIDLPEGKDTEDEARKRDKTNIDIAENGGGQYFIPRRCELVNKTYLTMLKKSQEIEKKLNRMYSGKQTKFDDEAQAIMTAFNITGYGCSDEATSFIQTGAWLGMLHELGVDVPAANVGKQSVSSRTLARWELNLATDCLATVIQEMKEDGATNVGIITDHGHRHKQDHFVIVICWAGKDKDGKRTLKFFCPSIDKVGHSAKQAANGVKKVLERLSVSGEKIKAKVLTGDAGGGGAVQHLYKELKELGIMTDEDKETNCALHGMQKAIENASKNTMGDQGMGCRTPFQMLYIFAALMSSLKEQGGLKYVDTMWSEVNKQLKENEEWKSIAQEKMTQAWKEHMTIIKSLEDDNDQNTAEKLDKLMNEAPRNIQDPVWTRWASVSPFILFC